MGKIIKSHDVLIITDSNWTKLREFTFEIQKITKELFITDGWEGSLFEQPKVSVMLTNGISKFDENIFLNYMLSMVTKASDMLQSGADAPLLHVVWCVTKLPVLEPNEQNNIRWSGFVENIIIAWQKAKEYAINNSVNLSGWLTPVTMIPNNLLNQWATTLGMFSVLNSSKENCTNNIINHIFNGLELTKRFDGPIILQTNYKGNQKMLCETSVTKKDFELQGFSIYVSLKHIRRIAYDSMQILQRSIKRKNIKNSGRFTSTVYLFQIASLGSKNLELEAIPLNLLPTTKEAKLFLNAFKMEKKKDIRLTLLTILLQKKYFSYDTILDIHESNNYNENHNDGNTLKNESREEACKNDKNSQTKKEMPIFIAIDVVKDCNDVKDGSFSILVRKLATKYIHPVSQSSQLSLLNRDYGFEEFKIKSDLSVKIAESDVNCDGSKIPAFISKAKHNLLKKNE
jgi:hypothetical protein